MLTLLLAVVVAVGGYLTVGPGRAAVTCTVSAKLVNSCRPWLGAWANTYAGHTGGLVNQISDHENRLGRQVDWVHAYAEVGTNALSADMKTYATRANTTLLLAYKPGSPWSTAGGGNATVNAGIDSMANSIKSIAPKKIVLSVWHEPENDVTPSTTSCTGVGTASQQGSPADYVQMWRNVYNRFNAAGVTNVIWGVNYMVYNGGTCIIKPLWPGNDIVDWVFADPYVNGTENRNTFTTRMDFVYDYFSNNSDATHDFASKPWGFAEWGVQQMAQPQAYAIYDEARQDLISNRYPKFKAYTIFDAASGPKGGGAVGKADDGTLDPVEQQHYNGFANDPRFTDAFYAGAAKVGDLNSDGIVNTLDLSILLTNWGAASATADLNHDGKVNVFDLSILLANWG